jgi:hypothetical protein
MSQMKPTWIMMTSRLKDIHESDYNNKIQLEIDRHVHTFHKSNCDREL